MPRGRALRVAASLVGGKIGGFTGCPAAGDGTVRLAQARVTRPRRSIGAGVACCVLATMLSPTALAATRTRVDAVTWPTLAVSVVLPRESNSQPRLFENGSPVSLLYASNVGGASTVALAVDHSQSMHGQALRSAVAVARRLLADKRAADRIAVFAIGSKAVQLAGFSRSTGVADAALGQIRLDRHYGTALYDGVALAARALQRERGRDKVLIVVTDGQETTSRASISDAAAAAADANVAVYPVAIENLTYKPGTLDTLARATRGAFFGQLTRAAPDDYAAIAADIRRTWRIDYTTAARPGDTVTLRIVQAGSPPVITRVTIPRDGTTRSFLSRNVVVLLALAVVGAIVLALVVGGRGRRAGSQSSRSRPAS
jgi:von Willebrand factor type A domain